MTRDEITQAVMAAKLQRGLSWQDLADAISKPVVWVAGALFGQHPLDPADAATLATKLGLPERAAPILAATPRCDTLPAAVSTDPASCRVYEVLRVYGPR
jgi:cyanate lyase